MDFSCRHTYGRCPNGSGALTTTTSPTKDTANDCSVAVKINEIESDNGTPVDWVEPFNLGAVAVGLSGFTLPDNDNTRGYAVQEGTRNGAPAQAAETV